MAVRKKNGGWEVYYRDPVTRAQRSRFFKTQKDAEKEDRRVKYMLEFEREKIIEEDAKRTPIPKPVAKSKPKPDPARYLIKNVLQSLEEWEGKKLSRQDVWVIKKFNNVDVRTITRQTFSDFYLEQVKKGVKPQSVARQIVSIRRVLLHAVNLGYIDSVPNNIKIPAGTVKEYIPPTEEELARLYSVAQHHIQRVIVLGAYFGMRVGPCELLSLRWDDVDFGNWVIRLQAAKKNHREPVRVIPIPEAFRDTFLTWKQIDSKYEGCSTVVNYYGRKIGRCEGAWRAALRNAGITRELRPYDLRHAFATNGLKKGLDLGTLAKIMGHVDGTMILRTYQYVAIDDKASVLEKMSEKGVFCMEKTCMDKKASL